MHFVVSWDIKGNIGQSGNNINEEMKACLKAYPWVRPLATFYIVNVNSQQDWDLICRNLQAVGRKHQGRIDLVLTPLMQGGKYNGLLSEDLWNEINKRSV